MEWNEAVGIKQYYYKEENVVGLKSEWDGAKPDLRKPVLPGSEKTQAAGGLQECK